MQYTMKAWLSYGLMLVVLLPLGSKLAIITHFSLHRSEISRTLCENKDRPVMQCNGSCQLRKRLQPGDQEIRQGIPADTGTELAIAELVYLGAEVDSLPAASAGLVQHYAAVRTILSGNGHPLGPDQPPQA